MRVSCVVWPAARRGCGEFRTGVYSHRHASSGRPVKFVKSRRVAVSGRGRDHDRLKLGLACPPARGSPISPTIGASGMKREMRCPEGPEDEKLSVRRIRPDSMSTAEMKWPSEPAGLRPEQPNVSYDALATFRVSKSTLRFNAMIRPSTPSRSRIEWNFERWVASWLIEPSM